MREDHSSTGGTVEATDQHPKDPVNENPAKPFNTECIDLTPELPTNIGYVGGLPLPKKKA
jgi:hypothetical protein